MPTIEAPPLTLRDLLPTSDEMDGDASAAAEKVLAVVIEKGRVDLVMPALTHWVSTQWRSGVRNTERTRPVAEQEPPTTRHGAIARLWALLDDPAFRRRLAKGVTLKQGEPKISWAVLTADQHLERAAALRQHADDTIRTAVDHETIAELLALSGFETLSAADAAPRKRTL